MDEAVVLAFEDVGRRLPSTGPVNWFDPKLSHSRFARLLSSAGIRLPIQ